MDDITQHSLAPELTATAASCPIDHAAWSHQKTAVISDASIGQDTSTKPAIERTADGVWHVHRFQEARAILRSDATKQAGFKADEVEQISRFFKPAILYQEGQTHHQQRKQTSRFFTPKAVDANYRPLMEQLVENLLADLQRDKRADLSEISFKMARGVTSQIVGLTNSRDANMNKRIDDFFDHPTPVNLPRWHPRMLLLVPLRIDRLTRRA